MVGARRDVVSGGGGGMWVREEVEGSEDWLAVVVRVAEDARACVIRHVVAWWR